MIGLGTMEKLGPERDRRQKLFFAITTPQAATPFENGPPIDNRTKPKTNLFAAR